MVNGLIKCKIKLLNLQYFDAPGHKFILVNILAKVSIFILSRRPPFMNLG